MNTRSAAVALHPAARELPSNREIGATRRAHDARFLPTLFDRLCDDAPYESVESADAYAPNRTKMREIILRDLAYLLNTTNQSDLVDAQRYPQVANSTINYGMPALSGGYLSEKKWIDIENMIRHAIKTFEPRLMSETLRVHPLMKEHASGHYNVLTFEISGYIQTQLYPMEFTVQSAVDLETNRIELLETHR